MSISPDLIKTMSPKETADIAENVIYYGGFLTVYNKLMGFLSQKGSSTAILTGGPGSGKKTLIEALHRNFNNPSISRMTKKSKGKKQKVDHLNGTTKELQNKELKMIYIHPRHVDDDFTILNRIALELDMKPKNVDEFIESVDKRDKVTYKGKLMIVLYEFEEFCRRNQPLLYILTHLTQHVRNVKLLGVTMTFDSTSNLEKRVRSRLNALFFDLLMPYQTKEEYLEFASKLLGGHKIVDDLALKLIDMYTYGSRTISELKAFLCDLCDWDEKTGKLVVGEIDFDEQDGKMINRNLYLETIFPSLVKHEKDLLVYVCFYFCKNKEESPKFSLSTVHDYLSKNHKDLSSKFKPLSEEYQLHMETLNSLSLISVTKEGELIDMNTKFTLGIKPSELKQVIKTNPECRTSNPLWTELN